MTHGRHYLRAEALHPPEGIGRGDLCAKSPEHEPPGLTRRQNSAGALHEGFVNHGDPHAITNDVLAEVPEDRLERGGGDGAGHGGRLVDRGTEEGLGLALAEVGPERGPARGVDLAALVDR